LLAAKKEIRKFDLIDQRGFSGNAGMIDVHLPREYWNARVSILSEVIADLKRLI
jgi:hypothetical protein